MDSSPITLDTVRRLSAGRWLIPVLAAMADGEGARFSVLTRELTVSKSILSATLDRLQRDGWIRRNPGHGHPLRPEYNLTEAGRTAAAWSHEVMAQRRKLGLEPGVLGRWSLPLVGGIGPGWQRFSALQQFLSPITPRALSLELTALRGAELVDRREAKPRYGLTARGRSLAEAVSGSR